MARGPVFMLVSLGVLACASAHAADLGGYAHPSAPAYIDSRPALHTDLGRTDLSGVALDTNTYAWHDHLSDNVGRLGVNFRF